MPAPAKVIIDTDIGEDIDDLLVTAFALSSPEFEVLAITTVDGDTEARARIARRVAAVFGKPAVPVAAGYYRAMPHANVPHPPGTAIRQGELAPDEAGLPPACTQSADDLIASLAAAHPGEVYLLTIGSMTNAGQTLVRHPEAAEQLRAIVTNGGAFRGRPTEIGWNLRYDPVAAAVVAMSPARWVLLPENATRFAALREEDVVRLQSARRPTTELLCEAIRYWKQNKPDATKYPHLSDLNVFAYLLGGWLEARPGRVSLTLTPGRLPRLAVEDDAEGPHLLGDEVPQDLAPALRNLFLTRVTQPIAQ
jgi:purine nucleosidase